MYTNVYNLKELLVLDRLEEVLLEDMHFETKYCDLDDLLLLFESLREDLIVGMESGYVDAMYRDEYYHYFATKLHSYERNCVKITFFEPGVLKSGSPIDFKLLGEILKKDRNNFNKSIQNKSENDKTEFLGFVILRPVLASIGRNVISMQARKPEYMNVLTCKTGFSLTALGFTVDVTGFPHCSQDREMMKCAETALWALVEYYGHKYSKYRSILPSDILSAMKTYSPERQLPSSGLTFDQISLGLTSFGFTPQSYMLWKDGKIDEDVKEIFSCYIESGFPLALWLEENSDTKSKDDSEDNVDSLDDSDSDNVDNVDSLDDSEGNEESILISHAAICIGRENKKRTDNIQTQEIHGDTYYVWNRSLDNFVFWDDNVPCFQKSTITQPTLYYNKESVKKYKKDSLDNLHIRGFIAPLPSKVYLDANAAISISKSFMALLSPRNTVIRTILVSSRELRNHLATSLHLSNKNKESLLKLELPRFVWVSELSSKKNFEDNRATGLILIDATESSVREFNQNGDAPLILFVNNHKYGDSYAYNANTHSFDKLILEDEFVIESFNNSLFLN